MSGQETPTSPHTHAEHGLSLPGILRGEANHDCGHSLLPPAGAHCAGLFSVQRGRPVRGRRPRRGEARAEQRVHGLPRGRVQGPQEGRAQGVGRASVPRPLPPRSTASSIASTATTPSRRRPTTRSCPRSTALPAMKRWRRSMPSIRGWRCSPVPAGEDTSCAACHGSHETLALKSPASAFARPSSRRRPAVAATRRRARTISPPPHAARPGTGGRPTPDCLSCHKENIVRPALAGFAGRTEAQAGAALRVLPCRPARGRRQAHRGRPVCRVVVRVSRCTARRCRPARAGRPPASTATGPMR